MTATDKPGSTADRRLSKRQPKPIMAPMWRFRAVSPTGRIHDLPVNDKEDAVSLARVFGYTGTVQFCLRTPWEDVMIIGEIADPDPGAQDGQGGD